MDKIYDNSLKEFYNIPKNDKLIEEKESPISKDVDDFIFGDEKTIPSER